MLTSLNCLLLLLVLSVCDQSCLALISCYNLIYMVQDLLQILLGHKDMAMLQDQNINIHFDGASLFGKNDTSKALKKGGGLGGRKALNDISNSAKPSSLQASKKNSASVISIGKDLNATKNKFISGTKDNLAKVPDKGGRKALTDLTNSSKPSAKQGSKKGLDKKLSAAAAANIPTSIAEEQFLHDHKKCIKAQRKVIDMDFFLKEVGLENDIPVQLLASPRVSKLSMKSMSDDSVKLELLLNLFSVGLFVNQSLTYQLETPVKKHFEVEEMPELLMCDQVPKCEKKGTSGDSSPSLGSPISPKLSYMSWKDVSDPCFTLTGTPDRQKY
ncbi:hypothetical protein H5410_016892 [Solanum commersonii]|uniref:Neuron navigator 1 n=1 Tax=Solanum commersonii TaxID=4109 RepID=A0A9J5ZYQ1_SOLCO|nr:hypothetical protein H5410_016892 [Solanum commersonii]